MSNKLKVVTLIFLSLIIIFFAPIDNNHELEIHYIHGQYALDVANPYEVVGFSDYVFVAKIHNKSRTVYEYSDIDFRLHVYRMSEWQYTHYSITVVKNIKGNIKKDVPITLEQFGGISSDRKYIMLMEGDVFFEPDTYYIIVANANRDGELVLSSPNGYRKLDISSEKEILDSKEYKAFIEYFANEVKFERDRNESIHKVK